jgi:hypothetical protein
MKFATITTKWCDLEPGDVIAVDGRLAKVLCGTRTQITVRYLNWLERAWFKVRGMVRIRGFWARVWNR